MRPRSQRFHRWERGRTGVGFFTFLPLKALQVGDNGLGVGSYLRF